MFNSLRIIFAGTPDFAAWHLNALINTNHQVVGVFTQPDRPAGRGKHILPSPVKKLAQKHNLKIFQPLSLYKTEIQQIILNLNADIMIVVAYSLIIPPAILPMPKFGCINVHGSLLPRWRGAAPIQRALCAGDNYTGITIIQMDAGLDTGPMLNKITCVIKPNDTSKSLHYKLAQIGANALINTLNEIILGCIKLEPQNNDCITYAKKINKKEAQLDWRLSAIQLERYIRAFNPWPISYFLHANQVIRVWHANVEDKKKSIYPSGIILATDKDGIHIATGKGILVLKLIQLAGKKIMPVKSLLNSNQKLFIPGTIV